MITTNFTLNDRLESGGYEISRVSGCRILLKNEANFPWFIIVPEVPEGIEDLHQLDEKTYSEVTSLLRRISIFVQEYFKPEKLNVACIGNIVRQMHIHVVARNLSDPAWPGVVWACDEKRKYTQDEAQAIVSAARAALGD
ncbi:HIT family protein [Luteolibacter algae]|uniref:HIT family protein n=1 Tax=Luteolibacter algae TaxID=454151 RepID=A0ABW5DAF1_9BACT